MTAKQRSETAAPLPESKPMWFQGSVRIMLFSLMTSAMEYNGQSGAQRYYGTHGMV